MGASLRARAVLRQRAADRRAAREAADREAASVRKSMLDRREAARYVGRSVRWLAEAWSSGQGPRGVKFGTARQSRVYYAVEELDRWRLDPTRYDTPSRDPDVGPFEPPRRGDGSRSS